MENPLIHAVFMGKSSANERFNIVEYGCDKKMQTIIQFTAPPCSDWIEQTSFWRVCFAGSSKCYTTWQVAAGCCRDTAPPRVSGFMATKKQHNKNNKHILYVI